jgi:hypothetical protein
LRILFHHFFPKGELAPAWAPRNVDCPFSSLSTPILSMSGTQALSHPSFPCRQAAQRSRQPARVHALHCGSQEPML